MPETIRTLFEDYLPPKMLVRLNEINNSNGPAIFEKVKENKFPMSAEIRNNVATITCRDSYDFSHTLICHEIWHLYIKVKLGIYSYQFEGSLKDHLLKEEAGETNFINNWEELSSAIEHFYFLPLMLDEDFTDCYSFTENTLNDLGEINCDGNEVLPEPIINSINRRFAIQIIHILILSNHSERANEYLESFERNCNAAYILAQEAYNLIQNFKSINQEPDILKQLISIFWKYPNPVKFASTNNVGIFS